MNFEIKSHVAIVQGASKGLGRGVAEALAAEGCDLILTARTAEALGEAAEAISRQHGVRALAHPCDSADLAEGEALVALAEKKLGRLDIIVCNSGGPPAGGIRDLTADQWRGAAELLLVAPAMLLQRSLPLLKKSPAPRFFVITSSSTVTPVAGLTLSNTYRPGIVGLIKTLTEELAPEGVCCHSIAPGRFDTARLDHLIRLQAEKAGKTPAQITEAMVATIPAGRLGEPVEIGRLVSFLSSPHSSYLRGGNWLVDGGLVRVV